MKNHITGAALILAVAGILAATLLVLGDGGTRAEGGCDAADFNCPGETATAEAIQTTLSDQATKTWATAGALLNAVVAANVARIETVLAQPAPVSAGRYEPAHCHFEAEHELYEVGELLSAEEAHALYDDASALARKCVVDSAEAMLEVLTATAEARP